MSVIVADEAAFLAEYADGEFCSGSITFHNNLIVEGDHSCLGNLTLELG